MPQDRGCLPGETFPPEDCTAQALYFTHHEVWEKACEDVGNKPPDNKNQFLTQAIGGQSTQHS